ncbi:MAG: ABC transporter permease [Spirochaetales bacterium]|nr:ABC transporter permease [Spirochaetales bacterium]
MLSFIVKRVLKGLLCVWFVWTVIFFLVRMTGDPTDWMLQDGATEQERMELRADMHLDDPVITQYVQSLSDFIHGNPGKSYFYHRDVSELYAERLNTTLKLALPSLLLSTFLGILIGTIAALKHDTLGDRTAMVLAVILHTMPVFCLGLILIFIFSLQLRVLPSAGSKTLKHLIMPMITMAAGPTSSTARLTRSSLLDVLPKEYMDGARMKGLPERVVIIKHALRNSLIPVVTSIGMQLGTVIGGAVVIENVFSWPGLGMLIVTAANNRDFPTVQYGVLLVAICVTIANILIDISYGFINPRIRESFK